MKKENWYRSLNLCDDAYIAEAHPDNVIRRRRTRRIISLVAACACLALIACSLWLFIPFKTEPPDVSRYADSEYYGLIQKLNVLTFKPPQYKNNAEKLKSLFLAAVADNKSGTDGAPEKGENISYGENGYHEITDNQVEGIIEADRIKRSNTHIYYLDNEVLRIYAIDQENTAEVGSYQLLDKGDDAYLDQWEFYLSDDGKTVTVITQCYERTGSLQGRCVELVSLDVSSPGNIEKKAEFKMTGEYMSSRKTNGHILLLTEFVIDRKKLDFGNETTFLPQIDAGEGAYSMPADMIVSPEQLNDRRYTVVVTLDEDTLDLKGTAAFLSYAEDVYVSEEHVFLTRVFADIKDTGEGRVIRNAMTEISCLTYGEDGLAKKGSTVVRGYIKDQWSMDEYEGVLRVFTTTNATPLLSSAYPTDTMASVDVLQTATGLSSASLYVINLATFEIKASVIDFAPQGEEIQSVRFDKTMAYACTSIERSDPVFFFDLSDLDDITYKDTGTIDGYSTSLINLGNGYLLGIGRGKGRDDVKVEVYEETDDGVRSVSAYEIGDADYSTTYKSYYVDRRHQLVGFGVSDPTTGAGRYILLFFDGYELLELENVALDGTPTHMRGVYIDGYMYMFGKGDCKVAEIGIPDACTAESSHSNSSSLLSSCGRYFFLVS